MIEWEGDVEYYELADEDDCTGCTCCTVVECEVGPDPELGSSTSCLDGGCPCWSDE